MKAIISNIAHCALNILFYFPIKSKNNHVKNKLSMRFLSVLHLVPSLIFRAWIVTDQFCWISFLFNLTQKGWKEEKMAKGAGEGWLFEGGDYSREAINRGTAIIRGNTVSDVCIIDGAKFPGSCIRHLYISHNAPYLSPPLPHKKKKKKKKLVSPLFFISPGHYSRP